MPPSTVGFVVGKEAMDLAVSKARVNGVGVVAARRSTHSGCMGFYASQATEAGMIGMVFTNLGSHGLQRPPGGKQPLLGTNVMAVSAPTNNHPSFMLDMSVAAVSAGRIRVVKRRNEVLPPGWLADDAGNTVTEPGAYEEGSGRLQFIGTGPGAGSRKGYGLALLMEILCSVLAGANVGPNDHNRNGDEGKNRSNDHNIGHFLLAIDPGAFRPHEDFTTDLDRLLSVIFGCPSVQSPSSGGSGSALSRFSRGRNCAAAPEVWAAHRQLTGCYVGGDLHWLRRCSAARLVGGRLVEGDRL